jgi:hypothetical protein
MGPPESPWQLSLHPPRTQTQSHDGVNNVTIVQVVARFVVNVVDTHLLQPPRRAEASLRGSTGTDHRQDLVIHWIAPDSVHRNRRQVRVGNAILRLLSHRLARHCHSWEAVPDAVLRQRTQCRLTCSTQHEVRPAHYRQRRPSGNGLK